MTNTIKQASTEIKRQVDKLSDVDRTALTAVMYNLMFVNDLATSAIFDAFQAIEGAGLARHRVRGWMSRTNNEIKMYNAQLNIRTGGYIGFLADLYDLYQEENELDIKKLRYAIVLALGKMHARNPDMISYIYMAMTFIMGSVHNVKHCLDGFKHLERFHQRFEWLALKRIETAFGKTISALNKMTDIDKYMITLDNNKNVENGFKIIAKRAANADHIIDVCNRHARMWEEDSVKNERVPENAKTGTY